MYSRLPTITRTSPTIRLVFSISFRIRCLGAKELPRKFRRDVSQRFTPPHAGPQLIFVGPELRTIPGLTTLNSEPRIVDEQRLRIRLRRGQLEVRTENSADLALFIS